jgi:hypothetical protein
MNDPSIQELFQDNANNLDNLEIVLQYDPGNYPLYIIPGFALTSG